MVALGALSLIGLLALLSACQASEKPIRLTSTPSGAKVLLNDTFIGTTPLSLTLPAALLPRGEKKPMPPLKLSLYKPGFLPYTATLPTAALKSAYHFPLAAFSKSITFKLLNSERCQPATPLAPALMQLNKGKPQTVPPKFKRELTYGSHEIFIYKAGCHFFVERLVVDDDRPEEVLLVLQPSQTRNRLSFESGEERLAVLWEGHLLGTTPLTLTQLPTTPHRFTLRKKTISAARRLEKPLEQTFKVTLTANEKRKITLSPAAAPLTLLLTAYFKTPPGRLLFQLAPLSGTSLSAEKTFFKPLFITNRTLHKFALTLPAAFANTTYRYLAQANGHYPLTNTLTLKEGRQALTLRFHPRLLGQPKLIKKITLPAPFAARPYLWLPLKNSFYLLSRSTHQALHYDLRLQKKPVPVEVSPSASPAEAAPLLHLIHPSHSSNRTFSAAFSALLPGEQHSYALSSTHAAVFTPSLTLKTTITEKNHSSAPPTATASRPLNLVSATLLSTASDSERVFFLDRNSRIQFFDWQSPHYTAAFTHHRHRPLQPLAVASEAGLLYVVDGLRQQLLSYTAERELLGAIPLPKEFTKAFSKPSAPFFLRIFENRLYLFTRQQAAYYELTRPSR